MSGSAVLTIGRALQLNSAFAADVREGLTRTPQKTAPAWWLYDAVGSALFEVITLLPEYGLTRADDALLRSAAPEIIERAADPHLIVELGSGSGSKTRHLLGAAAEFGSVVYKPIDISRAALEMCETSLRSLQAVRVEAVENTYLEGIDTALAGRNLREPALVLFLGSTIGNFARDEAGTFLHRIRQRVNPGDSLLLGADLVKPRETLIRAYDDDAGVTAAFNMNLLARINRELDADFDLRQFVHEARFNERHSRIEMHLKSCKAQRAFIRSLNLTVSFRAEETIWTESSHKFRAAEIRSMGEQAGWRFAHQWIDESWGFAETLFTA